MRATLMIALALALALLLAACSAVSTDPQQWLTPTEAIHAINASPDKAARGHFSFVVQGMGERGDWTFLNSEADYRHPDCLTIRLRTAMVPALEQRLGVSLSALQGRRIAVMGQAVEAARMGWGVCTVLGVAGKGEKLEIIPRFLITGRKVQGGSFGGAKGRTHVPQLVDMYLEGKIDLDGFISHRMPLDDVNRAFELMEQHDGIRTVLTF